MPATIEVITGPMFGGKTKELLRRIERSQYARKRILAVRPMQDTRVERSLIAAYPVATSGELFRLLEEHRPDLLAIDEAQFFEPWIVDALMTIRDKADGPFIRIIVAGLDMDYKRRPFRFMPQIMAIADKGVAKQLGVCMKCGAEEAAYTQALSPMLTLVQPGNTDMYEVRCLACHTIT